MTEKAETANIGLPRLLVAAPSSGSGKTLITCGLLEILKRHGMEPHAYKCGPDYIDPMFHRQVQGIESGNLDPFFSDADGLREILREQEGGCAVLEGVMGIYDGLSAASRQASCYETAEMTDTPILLAVDASGVGRTVISLIQGILLGDDRHLIRGILLNRISEGFCAKLGPVLEEELAAAGFQNVRFLGGIPRVAEVSFESRHLGLKLPEEIGEIRTKIRGFADVIEKHCDVDGILEIMGESAQEPDGAPVPVTDRQVRTGPEILSGTHSAAPDPDAPVIAVARDEAFCFYYRENLRALERAGARLAPFSPMHDRALPEGTAGLLLGGGYPELHLEELHANADMLTVIRTAIREGMPSIAECGGFMYLHRSVTDRSGNSFPLVGTVDGECTDAGHPVRFGYLRLAAENDHASRAFGMDLTGLKGHEFHYYETTAPGDDCTAEKPASGQRWRCMYCDDTRMWGFPHFYYGSRPEWANGFVRAAKEYAYGKQ